MAKKKRKRKPKKGKVVASAVLFTILLALFLGTVTVLLVMIKIERDKQSADTGSTESIELSSSSEAEDSSSAPMTAVTELSSSSSQADDETMTTTTADPLVVIPGSDSSSAAERKKEAANSIYDLSGLEGELKELINGFQGDWQIYVRHMESDEELVIDDRAIYAASLIKLFAAGATYQSVADGKLQESQVDDIIRQMISYSDNESFDSLVDMLDREYITTWCMQNGFWNTVQTHKISSEYAYENERTSTATDNTTSVRDVGRLLSKAYKGELVNKEASEKIIQYMKMQQYTEKIPAGVPEGTEVANKTGETDNTCHDSAIVYCDTGDYVLVVMGDTPGFGWTANDYIVQISQKVYEYFNGDPDDSSGDDEDPPGVDGTTDVIEEEE